MKNGPSSPKIKSYIKACESAGYTPTSARLCFCGDVVLFFGASEALEETMDEWEIKINET
jgi:hypothetical protein